MKQTKVVEIAITSKHTKQVCLDCLWKWTKEYYDSRSVKNLISQILHFVITLNSL